MAEAYSTPVVDPNQGDDNEQRIDGDGQEVNALRFLGAGGPPAPPPPAITPVSSGVSQPLQTQPPQPQPSQTPHLPPQSSQHSQQAILNPTGFDFNDPSNYSSMQMPSVPMSGPYGMPGQVPGMMGGGPMMMMPPYNYMYPPYFMHGAYPQMPTAPSNQSQSQLLATLNALRIQDPKFYREWYKEYLAHKKNPKRVPFPPIPGVAGAGSSQTLPSSYGRSRKESTRSSVNGDPYRHPPNESFANLDYSHVPGGGASTSMSLAHSRSHNYRQQPRSGRTSVNGDYRQQAEDDFEIDRAAEMSSFSGIGGNGILHSTQYPPNERDRPPTQSGRSSTIGEPYRLPPGDVYGGYSENQPESLGYDNSYGFRPIAEQVREPSPRRMTPLKFSTFHCKGNLIPFGLLMKIKNSGTVIEFLKMKPFVSQLPEYKEMELFPGPLTPTVIQFCKRKISKARSNTAQIDRENYILLWEFLILMLRQNGDRQINKPKEVGSDVADLLLEAAEKEEKLAAEVEEVRDGVEGGEGDEEETEEIPPVTEPELPPEIKPRDEEKLVKQFCEHLLHGHKKNALDFAMDNDLWGYALFFASKMDERSYGHVLARFANGIPLNSPLQTLYHVMCGKQPASVMSCADESFGDWKPHLAMLLSNNGYKPDVENKAILTLGDTLISRNHLFAAQFCFLMGHEEFHKDSRLGTLLGYSSTTHNILEATQMTEVYEFARKLADPHFSLGVSFLQSKLSYAESLITYGFVQEGLSYCEEITKALKMRKIEEAELKICWKVLQLSERLAVSDESGSANATWIEDLRKITTDPLTFCGDLRKLSLVSSTQEQSSDRMSVTSQNQGYSQQQQQSQQILTQPQDIYDQYSINQQNQNNMVAQDSSSSNPSQFETAVSSTTVSSMDPPLDPIYPGIGEVPQQQDSQNWNNSGQMNGGLHISSTPQIYDVNYQQQQTHQPQPMNSISSTNMYNAGSNPGNYQQQPMPPAYPAANDKLPNQTPSPNNNYWYNPNTQSQPPIPSNETTAPYQDQGLSNSAIKKKSVRFEDEHEQHADVESIGNSILAGIRARQVSKRSATVDSSSVELKSAIKCANGGGEHLGESSKSTKVLEGSGRFSPESGGKSGSDDKSLVEVEYKSTYPIDEPIESVLKTPSSGSSNNFNAGSGMKIKVNPVVASHPHPFTPPSYDSHNHRNSKTFPVDRECCDVNEPCEDHDFLEEYEGDENVQNGEHHHQHLLTSQFSGYDKTDSVKKQSADKKSGDKKSGKDQSKTLDGKQQDGWFSGILKTLRPNKTNQPSQMKLPDDKNPTIVWDPKQGRWVNTAADGDDDDLAPAGPPPKDSDLMGGMGGSKPPGPMSNGPMSLPPNINMQSIPPQSANSNVAYQQTQPSPALNNTGHYQNGQVQMQQQNNQQHQGMMMNPNHQQQQHQQQQQQPQNSGMMIPGMPPSNPTNKYKLQKGRNIKSSYVDVLNPNGRTPGTDAPAPTVPLGNVPPPQVPNMFIPPSIPMNQSSDGPVSFLTAPSEEIHPSDQNNSQAQAPPMFNPAQFQQGYPQGQ